MFRSSMVTHSHTSLDIIILYKHPLVETPIIIYESILVIGLIPSSLGPRRSRVRNSTVVILPKPEIGGTS